MVVPSQDNSGNAAALGMVLSWGVAVIVAIYTLLTMFLAMKGRTTCTSLVALSRLCALFAYGVIIATTVRGRRRGTEHGLLAVDYLDPKDRLGPMFSRTA